MFDVGDLPVLTFGSCVLKTGVTKWPLKLHVRFFNVFQNPKNITFYFFELLHTFAQTLLLFNLLPVYTTDDEVVTLPGKYVGN